MIGILGQHSYICNRFITYIADSKLKSDYIPCRDNSWQEINFSQYETLLCPIGIAHVSTDPLMENQYYAVNRDLPVSIAKKAKIEGVKQFVFFSSMIVYGADKTIGNEYLIDVSTEPMPENFYGKSKLEAEMDAYHHFVNLTNGRIFTGMKGKTVKVFRRADNETLFVVVEFDLK